MEHLGHQVSRLIRVSYGPFQLGDLDDGEVEEIRPRIVASQLGLAPPGPNDDRATLTASKRGKHANHSGSRRGAKLTKLDAVNTRPTADRVRESLFNILDSGRFGRALHEAVVIDAFAGTGALGLEALSRGATSACFIEQSADALLVLRANVKKLDMHRRSQIITGDATSLLHWQHAPATILFADAPYHTGGGQKTPSPCNH